VLQLKKIKFASPMLDLGCGDGTFSFTLFGGKCDIDFDTFRTETKDFYKGRDIYDQPPKIKPRILVKPRMKIDVGLDWKKNLLDKAKDLKLYDRLIQHDLNKPLPFDNECFNTIFSNVFYWIKNLSQLLSECNRILKKKGKLILCVPDVRFRENLIYNLFLSHGHLWAKYLDRGIYSNIGHCYSYTNWKKLLEHSGFRTIKHSNYLSENFVQFHNIGMRPYSPYVIEMANSLKSATRKRIKRRLMEEITPIIESYVEYETSLKSCGSFHLFVLQKY